MARKKEFDEDVILEKAMNLFWRKGYHATSAQDLANELELNRSSIYNTFLDKRTLFQKSLKLYQKQKTNAMIAFLDKSNDPKETIKGVFGSIVAESIQDELSKGCFMVNTAVELSYCDSEINNLVKLNNQSVEEALSRLILRGQRNGLLSSDKSPEILAKFIFANITSIRVSARSGVDKETLENIVGVILSVLN